MWAAYIQGNKVNGTSSSRVRGTKLLFISGSHSQYVSDHNVDSTPCNCLSPRQRERREAVMRKGARGGG